MRKQILWIATLFGSYALGCWSWYNVGKCQGAIEAYDECTGQLKKMDDSLREKYPEVFDEE